MAVGRQTSGRTRGCICATYGHSNGQSVGNRVEVGGRRGSGWDDGTDTTSNSDILLQFCRVRKNGSTKGGCESNWGPTICNSPFYTHTKHHLLKIHQILSRQLICPTVLTLFQLHRSTLLQASLLSSPMRELIFMHRIEGEDETWEWVEEGDRIVVVAGLECKGEKTEMRFEEFFEVEKST